MGLNDVKEAVVRIESPLDAFKHLDGVDIRVAVTSGLKNAGYLMRQIAEGKSPYHFIEVMGCPGGCITGGGQPRNQDPLVREKRMKNLYSEDESKVIRKSHENPYIRAFYSDYLGEPNSYKAKELLHTHYVRRGIFNEYSKETFTQEAPKHKNK